jgi:17beta-estradiol 17-dehydrogenase / very-long-chain 3-oxoacyl-CoA reductase
MGFVKNILLLAGTYQLAKMSYQLGYQAYISNFRVPHDLVERYGQCFALITGATDGIGKEMAFEVARRGLNVLLVSRSQEKLNSVKSEIEKAYPKTQVATIQADLSKADDLQVTKKVYEAAQKYDVGVVINNVGVFETANFEEQDIDKMMNMIVLNCFPTVLLSRFFMEAFTKRAKKSAIVNVGSECGDWPSAFFSTYSATKAHNNLFSEGLYYECESDPALKGKIDVMSCRPGPTLTPMVQKNLPSYKAGGSVVAVQDVARGLLRDLGYEKVTFGAFNHALFYLSMEWFTPLSLYLRARNGKTFAEDLKRAEAGSKH